MGYSVFETPNDLIIARNLACYERDQARFERDVANQACRDARANADYLSRENQQLRMQLAKLSAEKWENPRSFATCPDGSVYILPSILTPNDSGGMEYFKTERQKRGELDRKSSG